MSEERPILSSKFTHRLLGVAAVIALCACGGVSVWQQKKGKEYEAALVQQQYEALLAQQKAIPTVTGSYLAARFAALEGDVGHALNYIDSAIGTAQKSTDQIVAQAYRLSLFAGDYPKALEYSQRLAESYRDPLLDPSVLRLVMAVKSGNAEAAAKHAESMRTDGVLTLFAPLMQAWVDYANQKEPKLEMIKAVMKHSGEFKPLLQFQLALIHDAVGNTEEAKLLFDEIAKKERLSHHLAEVLLDFYQRHLDKDAIAALKNKYEDDYNITLTADETHQPYAITAAEGISEIFYGVGSVLYSLGALREAEVPLQLSLELEPGFSAVQFLLGNIYEKSERFEEAMATYEQVLDHPAFGVQATIRQAYIASDLGDQEIAHQKLAKLTTTHPTLVEPVLTLGDIYRSQQQYTKAIEAYTKALEIVKTPEQQHWPVFYARGICQERSGKWQQAEDDFLEALRLSPDQPDVMNYLGYSWLIQNKHITRAKEMIEKAMVARPQDAHIIDSMGWALYHLSDYEGALTHLEQAADLAPRDPTVNEHLGDVYWKLGYELQARYQWERALLFEPQEPGQADGIRQKIASGIPAAEVPKMNVLSAETAQETGTRIEAKAESVRSEQ